jgi:iron(III) transport system substrate-binding protein
MWLSSRRRFLRTVVLASSAALLALYHLQVPVAAAGEARDWERQWDQIIKAAKKEGKIVVAGPPIPELRTEIPAKFKGRFGIEVEYFAGNNEIIARVRSERAAGLYTIDVALSGPDSILNEYLPGKMIDPIRPVLIHSEVIDPSKWKPGKLWFFDPDGQYALRLLNAVNPMGGLNISVVKPDEIKSAHDLLNPKYKGKIAGTDPSVPGSGLNVAAYLHMKLGEDFIKKLYVNQRVQLSRDRRQLGDFLARGTYPIVLGINNIDAELNTLIANGFPIKPIVGFLDAGGFLSAGQGIMVLMKNAPHPNAATIFVNWLASKEGQDIHARAERKVSARADADETWAPSYSIPKPGMEYYDTYSWEHASTRKELTKNLIRGILAR